MSSAELTAPSAPPPSPGRAARVTRLLGASSSLSGIGVVLGAFAASIVVGALAVAMVGVSPLSALDAMVQGSAGSRAAWGDSLTYATPRLLVAVSAIVAIRCGVFNLGGEGQLQAGAVGATLGGTLIGTTFAPAHLAFAVLLAMAFGAVWAGIAVLLKIWRGADEIIVTLMMNFIGIYLVKYLVQGPMQPPGSIYSASKPIAPSAHLPTLLGGTRLHAGFAIALVAAGAVWLLLYRTSLGTQLRAAGLNPRAARAQGIPVARLMIVSMVISGAVAGLAGAGEVLGVQYQLIQGFSANLGFEGLAIAFLAGLEPAAAVLVAVYFGMVQNGATQMESDLGVPAALALIMEALPIMFLAGARGWLLVRKVRGS
jgi:simple sugar transport system permease protein